MLLFGLQGSTLADVPAGSFPCPSGGGMCPPFNQFVEMWRDDVKKQMGSLPIDFLLAWIQIESSGSVCSDTIYSEVGIFQLMAGDNIAAGGTSIDAQHPVPPCIPNTSTHVWRDAVTNDQAYEQVRGGIQYVNYCRKTAEALLSANGYLGQPGWTDKDWSYWAMVKMIHVSPVAAAKLIQAGLQSGGVPADWNDMMQYGKGIAPVNWTDNASVVGAFGDGGGSVLGYLYSPTVVAVGVGVLIAIGGIIAKRKIQKRYPEKWRRFANKLHLPEKIAA